VGCYRVDFHHWQSRQAEILVFTFTLVRQPLNQLHFKPVRFTLVSRELI
jgi:hypothetical protein